MATENVRAEVMDGHQVSPRRPSMFEARSLRPALLSGLRKLNPMTLWRNPIIFIVEVGAVYTTGDALVAMVNGESVAFAGWLAFWLWLTVYFAAVAEAVAEARGKAQADSLRATRSDTPAKVCIDGDRDRISLTSAADLHLGDIVMVEAGDIMPGDGEVLDGIAYVSEAAITGESAPVLKEPGTDFSSSVTGGTQVVSDWLLIRITAEPGHTFLDRMIALVEGAERRKTPNELALTILLAGLTLIFLMVTVSIAPIAAYADTPVQTIVLIALLVTLIPTTIGGLLSAIGIAGMDRLVQRNVLATSGRAVEAAGDVNTLLLDKTGTITFGNRMASRLLPVQGVSEQQLMEAALLSSLADETPEGKSIVILTRERGVQAPIGVLEHAEFVPFTAETRISGIEVDGLRIIKGAADAVARQTEATPPDLDGLVAGVARVGSTPLVVAQNGAVLGVIELKDTVKPGLRERFAELRAMGIRTVMVTGDNSLTARAIAEEAGVDDFIAEAKPEDKITAIRQYQAEGRIVAMSGDGTNDAPALAQADVGVAMNTGTAAAKEAGNMLDLDSDPTKLIEIVGIGKQLLMTRGALTTFSIANDVAKYFAIIPAIFAAAWGSQEGGLDRLNLMRLGSPESAILSAIIFNALIIMALVPLALKGVRYVPVSAALLLRRNLLIYGLGGIVTPFVFIKLIDLIVNLFIG